jgi:hypothetical protein
MQSYDVPKKTDLPPRPEPGQKNVFTSPAKKGTYGMQGTVVGFYGNGRGPEFHYHSDPYDGARVMEMNARRASAAKRKTMPFKSSATPLDYFDSQNHVAASKVYTLDKPLPPPKKKEAPKSAPSKPFRPSQPAKDGYNSTFEAFPEYREDPLDLKLAKEKKSRDAEAALVRDVFKPVSQIKPGPTKVVH